jgi:hypothetical protein
MHLLILLIITTCFGIFVQYSSILLLLSQNGGVDLNDWAMMKYIFGDTSLNGNISDSESAVYGALVFFGPYISGTIISTLWSKGSSFLMWIVNVITSLIAIFVGLFLMRTYLFSSCISCNSVNGSVKSLIDQLFWSINVIFSPLLIISCIIRYLLFSRCSRTCQPPER